MKTKLLRILKENKVVLIVLIALLISSITIWQLASSYNKQIESAKAKINILEKEVEKKSDIELILEKKQNSDSKIELQKEKEAQAKLAYDNEKKKKEVLVWFWRCVDLNYTLIWEGKAIMPCEEYNEEVLEEMFASYNFEGTKKQALGL